MLTKDEDFKVRDSAIRVREIEADRINIRVGKLDALDAMIELANLANELAPLCERLLADNERLLRRVANLEGCE
jgi:hypothetical protein